MLPLVAPFSLMLSAAYGFLMHGTRPKGVALVAEAAALTALLAAVSATAALAAFGAGVSPLIGAYGLGLSARLDVVTASMLLLVTFIGWVVLRYSGTYLDGEERQGCFMGWLCLTLASVMLLVIAGNVAQLLTAWVCTSLALHQLLLFYPERIAAQRAARKKFITARIGDCALVVAIACLVAAYGTSDIAAILTAWPARLALTFGGRVHATISSRIPPSSRGTCRRHTGCSSCRTSRSRRPFRGSGRWAWCRCRASG